MSIKLIGTTTPGTSSSVTGYVQGSQFTCDTSGILDAIWVYCRANGSVRVAIYSDNGANAVLNLLAESDSTAVEATNWRPVNLTSTVNIVAGTKYWLLFQCDTAGSGSHTLTAWPRCYKAQAYGAFPATGAGFGYSNTVLYANQGWGTEAVAAGRSYGLIIG